MPKSETRAPASRAGRGRATYSVMVGPDIPFEGSEGKEPADFGPRTTAMILVVERTQPVCWMDPTQDVSQRVADVGINVNDGLGGEIASPHPGGANFGLRSGGCHFLSAVIDPDVFQGLLRGTVEVVP